MPVHISRCYNAMHIFCFAFYAKWTHAMELNLPWVNSLFSSYVLPWTWGNWGLTWWPKAFGCIGSWDFALFLPSITVPPLWPVWETKTWWGLHMKDFCIRICNHQPCLYPKIQGCPSSNAGLGSEKCGLYSYVVSSRIITFLSLGGCVCMGVASKPFYQASGPESYFTVNKSWVSNVTIGLSVQPFVFTPKYYQAADCPSSSDSCISVSSMQLCSHCI